MTLPEYLKEDTWLSNILGVPSFNIHSQSFINSKDHLASLSFPKNYFIQTKVDCDNLETCIALQKQGFLVIDTNVSYDLDLKKHTPKTSIPNNYFVRHAQSNDKEQVMQCASNSFIYTRYHLDPLINNNKADLIKSEWAGNFFNGKRGQYMILSIDSSNKVVGFCQILEPDLNTRIIDLIAVSKNSRRKGLAQAMISSSITKQETLIVGTQVSNSPSIRCYENIGFRHTKSQYVLHYHGL